jgi:hypothetical protein
MVVLGWVQLLNDPHHLNAAHDLIRKSLCRYTEQGLTDVPTGCLISWLAMPTPERRFLTRGSHSPMSVNVTRSLGDGVATARGTGIGKNND